MKVYHRLKIFALSSLLISGSVYGSVNGVRVSDGIEDVVFSFMSVPIVTFEDGILKVSSSEGLAEFPLTSEITFDFVDDSGINDVADISDIVFQITSTQIKIDGLIAEEVINVFDMEGNIIASSKADISGCWAIDTDSLPKSFLIFKTNTNSYKLKIRQ